MKSTGWKHISRFGMLCLAVVLANVVANQMSWQLDFTQDKRFTLSEKSKEVLDALETSVTISILLSDDIPANLKRLRKDCDDLITRMNRVNFRLTLEYADPLIGDPNETEENKQQLAEAGIYPMNINYGNQEGFESRLIYPYAILTSGDQQFAISLLEEAAVDFDPQVQLNQSIALLEFKFINALKRFVNPEKKLVVFTEGHGEPGPAYTADLQRNLSPFYNVLRINPDSVLAIPPEVEVVIVVKPTEPFGDRAKFQLDQFVMRGGRIIFALDRFRVNLDSIGRNGQYVPVDEAHNLDDLLFKYGVRLNYDLVQDMECTRIPMGTGRTGNQDQLQRFPWFYHPMAMPGKDHPVTSSLDRVNLFFPSSIDTIRTATAIKKHVLLKSSDRSRTQAMPSPLDFDILRYPPEPEQFNTGPHIMGVILEGRFQSNYANRPPQDLLNMYSAYDIPFFREGEPAQVAVIADGDLAINKVQPSSGQPLPLGYNIYEDLQFANKQLLLNLVEYMSDGFGVMGLRTREVTQRPLNATKILHEKTTWQTINIAIPLIFFVLFGWMYNFIRRRKYTR